MSVDKCIKGRCTMETCQGNAPARSHGASATRRKCSDPGRGKWNGLQGLISGELQHFLTGLECCPGRRMLAAEHRPGWAVLGLQQGGCAFRADMCAADPEVRGRRPPSWLVFG